MTQPIHTSFFPGVRTISAILPRHIANRLALLESYRQGSVSVDGHPVILQLEVTNRCTMKCPMCPRNNMTRPHVDMDLDLFKKIIDETHPWAEIAILHLLGEPLLNRDLPAMIRYCADHGVRTVLSTNVSVFNEEIGRILIESGLDVLLISFDDDALPPHTPPENARDLPGTFTHVEKFLATNGAESIQVIIQMLDIPETHDQATTLAAHWHSKPNVIVSLKPVTSWKGNLEEIKTRGWNVDVSALENSRCDRLWMWLTVFADGSLATCSRDYDGTIKLPSLRDHSVQDAWNGPGMRTFRAAHNKGRSRTSICKSCDHNPILNRSASARMTSCMFDHYTLHRLFHLFEKQID